MSTSRLEDVIGSSDPRSLFNGRMTRGILFGAAMVCSLGAASTWGQDLQMQPFAGEPLPGLTDAQRAMYEAGRAAYQRTFTPEEGLGPVFNLPSCVSCHNSPLGGPGGTTVNLFGFVSPTTGVFDPMHDLGGPVRQANAIDPACVEEVPTGANIDTRRLTLGAMGYGLIEAIPQDGILEGEDPNDSDGDGIRGFANWVEALEAPGTPVVGRFGWKAQLPTVLSFSADAAHNELGLTSLLIPDDNAANAPAGSGSCDEVADPELPDVASEFLDEVTAFQRYMAPPPQAPRGGMAGEEIFAEIGCVDCHRPMFTTSTDPGLEAALRGVVIQPYSDFLLHDMPNVSDGIPAGLAGGQQFRTPPLWGLRYRPKLMHDGSVPAFDFEQGVRLAIARHGPDGEAAASATAFLELDTNDQDSLIRFLRSLGRQDFDIDDDGDVDVQDYQAVSACAGSAVTPEDPCGVADLDLDGIVSFDELGVLAEHLGLDAGDCNHDGIPDAEQIASGSSEDENLDGVPDECEDVNCGERLHRVAVAGGSVPDQGERAFEVEIPELGSIRSVRLHLRDFHHPWAEQLLITLTRERPEQSREAAVAFLCGFDWDFVGDYEFRDDAEGGRRICTTVSGGTIPEGEYVPVDAGSSPSFMDAFAGQEAGGVWTLRILDTTGDSFTASLGGAFIDIVVDGPAQDCDGDGEPDSCEFDADGDGVVDDCDGCPDDPDKTEPGDCGCGAPESDSDADGTPDCSDGCPLDPLKVAPGDCGCGVTDLDGDGDGIPDCFDECPDDPLKATPGACGCGVPDEDVDGDGTPDCGQVGDCNGNGIDDATEISDGTASDCNLDGILDECASPGEVMVFGEDTHGETATPASLPPCIDAAAGGNHVAVVTVDGRVFCWGRNADGECDVPADLPRIVDVTCGAGHTMAIDEFGMVHAWGRNNYGQSDVPADLGPCLAVDGGRFHTVALTVSGEVRCWGRDEFGETSPPQMSEPVREIAAGDYHTLAILESGVVLAWGRNDQGQCSVPSGLRDVVALEGGSLHSLAVRSDGSVVGWGRNLEGQAQPPDGLIVTSVSAGWFCSIGIDEDGRLHAWGDLASGKGTIPDDVGEIAIAEIGATHTVVLGAGDPPVDTDGDGTPDCVDSCPDDPDKQDPGDCGCGIPDDDADGNGISDCLEGDVVHVPSDHATIAEAIFYAVDGIRIKLAPGVYREVVDFKGKAIILEGDPASPETVVLDGAGITGTSVVRMVTGEGPGSVLRGVTVRNGVSGTPWPSDPENGPIVGGAIFTHQASPVIEYCLFEFNQAEYGGAIYSLAGSPTVRHCVFRNNTAISDGGGLQNGWVTDGIVEDCTFEFNSAGRAGGSMHFPGGVNTVRGCTIVGNSVGDAGEGGGGISWYAQSSGILAVDSCDIHGNAAPDGGGIWSIQAGTAVSISATTICGNSPSQIEGDWVDLGGNCVASTCDANQNDIPDCEEDCRGDLNGDGLVDGTDLGLWLAYAGDSCDPGEECLGDLDGDGASSGADLGLLLGEWGICQ